MNAMQFKTVATAGLRSAIESNARLYVENPTTDRFAALEASMYAWQYAAKANAEELQKLIGEVVVGQWERTIYAYVINRNSAKTVTNLQAKGHLL